MLEVNELLSSMALSLMRPFGLFALFPMLSSKHLGGTVVRNGLVVLFSLPLLPVNSILAHSLFTGDARMLICFSQEFLLGILIGFAASIPFWALDIASHIIDTMRGASMASVLNPALGEQSSIFGLFFSQLFCAIFLSCGGMQHLLRTLYLSYRLLPPAAEIHFGSSLLPFLQQEWFLMFQLALSFALPSMLIMVLLDVALGLLNRSAQQLNVFFLSMPIKSAFTLLLLIISLSMALTLYQQNGEEVSQRILLLFGPLAL